MSHAPDLEGLSPLKRALLALTEMEGKLAASVRARSEPIAIIGLGCRFPGGVGPQSFWRMLRDGVDCVSEVPHDRWDVDAYLDPDPAAPGKMCTRWGGFLEQVDQFDTDFFGISPREALFMDPQQRVVLEVAWEALEDAGQTANEWSQRPAGVFLGVSSSDYAWHQLSGQTDIDAYASTGTSYSIIANRLSYVLDLKGPSLVVDTACSSSLVAVHLACQSLRNQECHLALAGGVNLVLSPMGGIALSKYRMMAPDGRCKTFDASADGFVRGEGCGVVVLKRLSDAVAAGDSVLALIRGSAVNQDGRSNGLTAPNMHSQQEVIRQALSHAAVLPQELQYVETHGTGTPLGDPIETEALRAVMGASHNGQECVMGSVKANIGHLEAAAGIAGLIKVVLALRSETIPPQIHFEKLNPHINLADSPLVVDAQGRRWPRGAKPRFAGVSSFGFGGTNAHVVLEEAFEQPRECEAAPSAHDAYLLPLSARSPNALIALARAYAEAQYGDGAVYDVCYRASVKRSHHPHRVAVVGRSMKELAERLRGVTHQQPALIPSLLGPVFVFGGEGDEWPAVGRGLLVDEPVFRETVDECEALLRGHVQWSLTEELLADEIRSRLTEPEIGHPALLALQVALARLWRSWGIEPAVVLGHSLGEIAAAHVAGALSLADAVKVAVHRGRLMQHAHANEADTDIAAVEKELQQALHGLRSQPATLPVMSTLVGGYLEGSEFDSSYWARHLREPVRFADAVTALASLGNEVFLELGPHPVLGQGITRCLAKLGRGGVVLASLRNDQPERETLLTTVGRLYELGFTIAWPRIFPKAAGCVSLPTYPWQHKRFWPDETTSHPRASRRRVHSHPLLADYHQAATSGSHSWQTDLDRSSLPYLNDHRVQGAMVLPAAAYVEMALAASAEVFGAGPYVLEEIVFLKALFLPESVPQTVQLVICEENSGKSDFQLLSRQAAAWVLHATGTIRRGTASSPHGSVEQIRTRCAESLDIVDYYEARRQQGLDYGPSFQGVQQIWRRDGEAIGRLHFTPAIAQGASAYQVHPALLDAGFQLLAAAVPTAQARVAAGDTFLPVRLASVQTHARPSPGTELWCHVRARSSPLTNPAAFEGDLFLMGADGQVVVEALGLRVERLEPRRSADDDDASDWLYDIQWRPKARPQKTQLPDQVGRWLILSDQGGIGSAVGALLATRGQPAVTIVSGECGPTHPEEFDRLLQENFGQTPPRGLIHLWSLDAAPTEAITVGSLEAAQELGCASALHLVQALGRTGWRQMPQLWLVTRGAQAVGADTSPINVSQSPLLGLAHVIALEHPELRCSEADLGPEASRAEIESLVEELFTDDVEGQVAFRGETRYVARLARWSPDSAPDNTALVNAVDQPFRLEGDKGGLDHLCLRATGRRPPGSGEVQIRVAAAALNINDLLKASGLYPDLPPGPVPLGSECTGTVVAVGSGVEGLTLGQSVVAIAEGSFGAFVTTPAFMVAPMPPGLTMEEAATLPIVFMTAVYALKHLGHLTSGDRVLIHAAAGGVGLAAIQVAQQVGAEIFATAGNSEERALLQSLGVAHVMDSRSLGFADEVMASTGGQGVDVVLNSLAGEAMVRSLDSVAPYGRFLELGKRDLYENRRVGLWPFRKGVSYLPVDVTGLAGVRPAQFNALWHEVSQNIVAGVWQPLPHQVFPIHEAVNAFRAMAHGEHIGKLVLSMRDLSAVLIEPATEASFSLNAEGTYSITGGLGGLGLQVAQWMVERKARHLVLVGRRDPTERAAVVLASLRQAGAQVVVVRADVSSASQMALVLTNINRDGPPLRGIIHAAGVLDDGLLLQQNWQRFTSVMAPKVLGAWNLHTLTLHSPLDFFVLFSSMASVVGSPGQGNYAAANAFMDGLARYRRAQGLSAVSINWGPWDEVGMAAATSQRSAQMVLRGISPIAPRAGLQLLDKILRQPLAQIAVMPVNWRDVRIGATASSLLADIMAQEANEPSVAGQDSGLRDALRMAQPGEQQAMLENYLREQLARVLGSQPAALELQEPLSSAGIDSLMAIEFTGKIQNDLRVTVPLTHILQGPSLRQLATRLLEQLTTQWLLKAPRGNSAEADGQEWEVVTI